MGMVAATMTEPTEDMCIIRFFTQNWGSGHSNANNCLGSICDPKRPDITVKHIQLPKQ